MIKNEQFYVDSSSLEGRKRIKLDPYRNSNWSWVKAVKLIIFFTIIIILSSIGTVYTVGLLKTDVNLSKKPLTMSFHFEELGPLNKDGVINKTISLINTCNKNVTLSFITRGFTPIYLTECVNISWDYNGEMIEPSSTIELTLTISNLSDHNIERFGFSLFVIGSESIDEN